MDHSLSHYAERGRGGFEKPEKVIDVISTLLLAEPGDVHNKVGEGEAIN